MKQLLLAVTLALLSQSPACAQAAPLGWNTGQAGSVSADIPLITTSLQSALTNERYLRIAPADTGFLTLTDNGANASLDIDFGVCPLTNGGTGGATAQAGMNNLADGCAGTAAASAADGDVLIRTGGAWKRLPKGSDGDIFVLSSGLPTWSASLGASNLAYVTIGNTASLSAERALTGTANRITIADGGANGAATLDIGTDVVTLTGSQTLTNKTLTSPSIGTNLVFELGANDTTITATAPAASRAYTIPDAGGAASFVMTEGAQTINGVKTMGSATRFNAQIQNSSGNTITLPSSAATLATLALAESLSNKTLPSAILQTQLTLDAATADYTITWDNPAAGRAYTVKDVGGNADFAMKTGTPTNQALAYGDGNKIVFLTPGSDGQVLKMASSSLTWGTVGGGFGGDGNQGAVTKGAVSETTPIQVNATTYSQTGGTTHTLVTHSVINATSTATFSGTTTVSNMGNGTAAGGVGSYGGHNVGSCGGSGGDLSASLGSGGGGGGNGGAGGAGADKSGGPANSGGRGGRAATLLDLGGSGGCGGGESDGGSKGGDGGARGGKLTVCAVGAISIGSSATVTANGAAGGAAGANGGGGGGGAGGTIIMASQTSVTVSSGATCTVTGGAGSAAGTANSGVGGGGGGGQWYSIAPSITHTTAPTAGGGAAGSGTGITTNSAAGSTGIVASLTITPTLPLIGLLQKDNNGMKGILAFARALGKKPDAQGCWRLSAEETVGYLSAWHATSAKHQRELAHAIEFGKQLDNTETCLLIEDDGNAEALRNAS